MKQPYLGNKIAEIRKQHGYTQEELAQQCNINVRTLQRIESGVVTPRSYTLKIILKKLDLEYLDSNDDETNNQSESKFSFRDLKDSFSNNFFDLNRETKLKTISLAIILMGLLFFGLKKVSSSEGKQINGSIDSEVSIKKSDDSRLNDRIMFKSFSCGWCFEDNNQIIGRDVKFIIRGVRVTARLIKFDKGKKEFKTSLFEGKISDNRADIVINENFLFDSLVKFSAKKIEKKNNMIFLNGKAKVTSISSESIETETIVITKRDNSN